MVVNAGVVSHGVGDVSVTRAVDKSGVLVARNFLVGVIETIGLAVRLGLGVVVAGMVRLVTGEGN